MSTEPIKVRVDSKAVLERFAKIRERGKELRPAMNDIANILHSSIMKNFDVGGRYEEEGSWRGGSKRWAPLADSTKRALVGGSKGYRRNGALRVRSIRVLAGKRILLSSRQLRNSIIGHATNSMVVVGTNKEYAAAHQQGVDKMVRVRRARRTVFGTRSRSVSTFMRHMKLPARPFLVVQDEDIEDSIDVLDQYLMED